MTTTLFTQLALNDFERARFKAFWRNLFSRLTHSCNDLLPFDQIRQSLRPTGQHYRGLQVVPLDSIVGSETRFQEFDRAFLPRQTYTLARWISIDLAHYEQVPLPPVELYKIGKVYFVRDGNHRISVARTRGQEFIDAAVTELSLSIPFDAPKRC